MQKWINILIAVVVGQSTLAYSASCTDQATYRDICHKAAVNSWVFQNFRSMPAYIQILELGGGNEFASFILENGSKQTQSKLGEFQKLEQFGKPHTTEFKDVGKFSGTTLRYIIIADHIKKMFHLPKKPKIVEIGAGFGGQCYILSCIQDFSKYYIYDLSEACELISKVVNTLSVKNVNCMKLSQPLPEKKIDLVISNYAFSECDKQTQLDYFESVIKKSKRGYMIYNQISSVFGIDSLTPNEFVLLLQKHNMHPKIEDELIPTASNNVLITWDTSR